MSDREALKGGFVLKIDKDAVTSRGMSTVTNIAVVDRCEGVRLGLEAYFDKIEGVRVVATCADLVEFIKGGYAARCDVVVYDAGDLQEVSDTVYALLGKLYPRFVLYTFQSKSACKWLLAQAAVAGYVNKNSGMVVLREAIGHVVNGEVYEDCNGTRHNAHTNSTEILKSSLSEREWQTVRLLSGGFSNKEIATKMRISASSIDTYRRRAAEKLQCHSRSQLVEAYNAFASMRGRIEPRT